MFTQIIENMNSEQDTFDELKYDITVDGWGTKIYRNKDGEYHRDEGPAVIYENGSKFWYQNGKRHRDEGPAIIFPDGMELYYIYDINYTKEEHELRVGICKGCVIGRLALQSFGTMENSIGISII
jgi:hypothetical protein